MTPPKVGNDTEVTLRIKKKGSETVLESSDV